MFECLSKHISCINQIAVFGPILQSESIMVEDGFRLHCDSVVKMIYWNSTEVMDLLFRLTLTALMYFVIFTTCKILSLDLSLWLKRSYYSQR